LRSNVGLNINNFVSTYEFEVTTIDSQIGLFCSYVDFFHELHLKYLKRFITKIQILYGQVNHDIKFDEVSLSKKSDKKKYMNEMKNELDKDTMRAIRSSIHVEKVKGDTSSDSEDSKEEEDIEVNEVNERIKSVIDISNNMQKNISPSTIPDSDIPFMILPISNMEPDDNTSVISNGPENPLLLVADEPVEDEPVAQEPISQEPVAQESVEDDPVSQAQESVARENVDLIPEPQEETKNNDDDWLDGFVTINAKKTNKKKKNKNKK
jgi:hypothetical protein